MLNAICLAQATPRRTAVPQTGLASTTTAILCLPSSPLQEHSLTQGVTRQYMPLFPLTSSALIAHARMSNNRDSVSNRVLPFKADFPFGTDPDRCTAACKTSGYKYAGLEFGSECCELGFLPIIAEYVHRFSRVWRLRHSGNTAVGRRMLYEVPRECSPDLWCS